MRYFNETYYELSAEFAKQENRDYNKSPLKIINDNYNKHEQKHPEWYKRLSFHDSYILNAEYLIDKLVLTVKYAFNDDLMFKICFYDYVIIENCDLLETTIIYDELYLEDKVNEFHLMVDVSMENSYQKKYFTVRFSKMEIIIDDLVFTAGKDIDQTINPSVEELESKLKS